MADSSPNQSSKKSEPKPRVTVSDKDRVWRKLYTKLKDAGKATRDKTVEFGRAAVDKAKDAGRAMSKWPASAQNWFSGLSENQRLAIYMALAGAAGGGVGAAVGGKGHRTVGTLIGALGAAGATGLARPLTDAISAAIVKANPKPESQFSGMATPALLGLGGAGLSIGIPHLLKPSATRLSSLLNDINVTDLVKRNPTAARVLAGDAYVDALMAKKPLPRRMGGLRADVDKLTGLRGSRFGSRLAHNSALNDALDRAYRSGLLGQASQNRLGKVRMLMASTPFRRAVQVLGGAGALGGAGYSIYNLWKSNKRRMQNGW